MPYIYYMEAIVMGVVDLYKRIKNKGEKRNKEEVEDNKAEKRR